MKSAKAKAAAYALKKWEEVKKSATKYTKAQLNKLKKDVEAALSKLTGEEQQILKEQLYTAEQVEREKWHKSIQKIGGDLFKFWKAEYKKLFAQFEKKYGKGKVTKEQVFMYMYRNRDHWERMWKTKAGLYNVLFNPGAMAVISALAAQGNQTVDMVTATLMTQGAAQMTTAAKEVEIKPPGWFYVAPTFMRLTATV
jgi:hypothetical protein